MNFIKCGTGAAHDASEHPPRHSAAEDEENQEEEARAAVAERTVREQARSIYSKAGLTGRAALSAFFLEDLLAPIEGVE